MHFKGQKAVVFTHFMYLYHSNNSDNLITNSWVSSGQRIINSWSLIFGDFNIFIAATLLPQDKTKPLSLSHRHLVWPPYNQYLYDYQKRKDHQTECLFVLTMHAVWMVLFNACSDDKATHDDVIRWKHFPCYWPFVQGIHRSPMNFLHKGQWRGALMFSSICAWINGCMSNREAGD